MPIKQFKVQHAILAAIFLMVAATLIGGAMQLWQDLAHGTEQATAPFQFGYRMQIVSGVNPAGKRAGVKFGDTLLEFNGRPFTGVLVMKEEVRKAHPGDVIPIVIQRGKLSGGPGQGPVMATPVGVPEHLTVTLDPETTQPAGFMQWIARTAFTLLLPAFCFGIGLWVVFQRPTDPLAWLLLAMMLGFGALVPETPWPAPIAVISYAIGTATSSLLPLWMALFGLFFPYPSLIERRLPWVKWTLIVLLGTFCLLDVSFSVTHAISFQPALTQALFATLPYSRVLRMIAISIFFYSLGEKSGTAPTADARRRLMILWMGVGVGLFPSFIAAVISLLTEQDFGSGIPQWLEGLAILALPLAPITLAYVIVVQRAMEVRTAIRQSAKYAVAKAGLWILRAIVVIAATVMIARVLQDPHSRNVDKVRVAGLAATLLVLRRKAGNRIAEWMDKRFFREAYRTEQVLSELSNEVRKFVEARPLLDTVTHRVSDILHVPHIALLLKTRNDYVAEPPDLGDLRDDTTTIKYLRDTERPALVYFDDPKSWVHEAPESEQQLLRTLDAQVLLPLRGREELLGVMSLGPKRSEEPYSTTDLQLLQSVATQTGLALDNSRLITSLAQEASHREKLNREMEIAREVQEHLFPADAPAIAGIDCAGRCRPALACGGDYYDFIPLPNGNLGLAIGDISGKGISAALLMASLRASLRGQTIAGPFELARLMQNVNQLVYEASTSNRYATFFYGEYDPNTRRFKYVNAGHNAPVVLRGSSVMRLEACGPVVGLLPNLPYVQAEMILETGDILLAYTDGISEAMTTEEEEWGEERMIACAQSHRELGAAQIIDRMMIDADVFTAGAEQFDDMTIVVMRVLTPSP